MNTSFDNVLFSLFTASRSERTKQLVMGTVPSVTRVRGHFADMSQIPETEHRGTADRTRLIQARVVVKLDEVIRQQLVTGTFLVITHKRNPLVGGWRTVAKQSQFIVQDISPIDSGDMWVSVGLVPKDQT
jgi:hypothetical protein